MALLFSLGPLRKQKLKKLTVYSVFAVIVTQSFILYRFLACPNMGKRLPVPLAPHVEPYRPKSRMNSSFAAFLSNIQCRFYAFVTDIKHRCCVRY